MKRPAFQFYPDDWTGNAKLKRCDHIAKGAWIDVLCLMHDSEEYGVLRWPLKDIAQAIGCTPKILRELADKGVIKGADSGKRCEPYVHQGYHARQALPPVTLIQSQDGPIWYSSRMVRDEYLRTRRGGETKFTADTQPNRSPTQRIGETGKHGTTRSPTGRLGDGASSPSSSPEDLAVPKSGAEGGNGRHVKGDEILQVKTPDTPDVERNRRVAAAAAAGNVELAQQIKAGLA